MTKAPGKLKVGPRRRRWKLLRGGGPLAPIIEQVLVNLLEVPALSALALATTNDQPRLGVAGVQLLLTTSRTFAASQIVGAQATLEPVVPGEALQHIGMQRGGEGVHRRFFAQMLQANTVISYCCADIAGIAAYKAARRSVIGIELNRSSSQCFLNWATCSRRALSSKRHASIRPAPGNNSSRFRIRYVGFQF